MSDLLTRTHRAFSSKRRLSKFEAIVARATGLAEKVNQRLREEPAPTYLARLRGETRPDVAEVLALVRELADRVLGLRPYDVQLVGALALDAGLVAEMATGEGKTLTIAPAVVLGLLRERQVHVVTANPYLAQRDHAVMAPLYEALGLTAGLTEPGADTASKQRAYQADVVYGTNSEFGFDYLRSNTALSRDEEVQPSLPFAIIDEVDSVLIDDARTPLILSAEGEATDAALEVLAKIATQLVADDDVELDFKARTAALTNAGYIRFEAGLHEAGLIESENALYLPANLWLLKAAHQATAAQFLYRRDRDYVLKDGEVLIVDTSTGRSMPGRRWEGGLHQAVEAKEHVRIAAPTMTLASITYQDFFGRYARLAGLTGTALTAAEEFEEMYRLPVIAVPTHRPVARTVMADRLYRTRREKFAALVNEIARRHASGQPVLIGTSSVGESERLGRLLAKAGVPHRVLNARQDALEADIIAQAGRKGSVTVATSMAGRGTDILLAGAKPAPEQMAQWTAERNEILALGGLCVLGSERGESRRIDDQLIGRCARQGDAGDAGFFLSLEDGMLRHFGARSARMLGLLAGVEPGQAFSGAVVDRFIAQAQFQAEMRGFTARRELLKYDTTIAEQREAVFSLRRQLLDSADMAREFALERIEMTVSSVFAPFEALDVTQWDAKALKDWLDTLGIQVPVLSWIHGNDPLSADEIFERLRERIGEAAHEALARVSPQDLTRMLVGELRTAWVEQLSALEELRENVGFAGRAGKNPSFVFSERAGALFEGFVQDHARVAFERLMVADTLSVSPEPAAVSASPEARALAAVQRALHERWVARNEPCPCGSGRRFKHCHGVPA